MERTTAPGDNKCMPIVPYKRLEFLHFSIHFDDPFQTI